MPRSLTEPVPFWVGYYLNSRRGRMPILDKETRQLINAARVLGDKGLSVFLEDQELVRLCAVVASDLDHQHLIGAIASSEELSRGYYGTPIEWFQRPVSSGVSFEDLF